MMVIQIQSPRDLFLYDLCAMYDIEQKMMRMLPVFAQECLDAQGKQAFMLHEQETRQHIRNLEQCFQILGSQPRGIENYTAAGLRRDHDMFLQQRPPAEAVSMFVLHSGYQSECLEIAAYHDLIEKANNLGLQDCVQLFQQNLQQEVNASTTLAAIARQLGQLQARAVQRPIVSQSTPDQPDVAVITPVSNKPNEATSSQVQNQSHAAKIPQVSNQPSMTGNSPATSQVQKGMRVVGSDKGMIGRVRDVREDDFLVDIPMHRDLYVPFSAIQSADVDLVMLNIPVDQIYRMNWPKPSLL
jgi:ferritin-like metal-binding protein YciE